MLTIIDYNTGNIGSIKNMLTYLGINTQITNNKEIIINAEKLILPGVGHYDYGMKQIKDSGLVPLLNKKVLDDKTPVLGICLGAQLMTASSEEGQLPGLGWIDATTIAFNKAKLPAGYKVPHMGWNDVRVQQSNTLWQNMPDPARFYFVHAYHFNLKNKDDVWLNATYGYSFCCGFHKDNIYGVQFHPEKSHRFGMQLLENFARL